jgi:hypothetical protein
MTVRKSGSIFDFCDLIVATTRFAEEEKAIE